MSNATSPGTGLHHTARGTGPRTIFTHCALAHGGVWLPVLRHLQVEAVCLDLPDHGQSPPTPGGVDPQRMTADAIADLAGGPVHLVGHSFGGTATLLAALDLGALVQSVTLIEPVQFSAAAGTPAHRQYTQDFAPFVAAWGQGDAATAARCFVDIWGGPGGWAAMTADQQAAMAQQIRVIPGQNAALNDDVNGILRPGRLEGLAAPVTLIEGAQSPAVISTIHDALADRLAHVTRHRIDGAGHMCPLTHAAQVAAVMPAALRA